MNPIKTTHDKQYSKRILYAVLGLSPQILTETLYALTKESPSFIPTHIFVLTTLKGLQHCKLALFKENGGWFYRFCKDYKLSNIHFSEQNIYTLRDAEGNQLEDIRTPAENNAVANQISQHIRQFTSEPDTMLHVSIAGGRKTMGFYAGYALSMFGREQDRLSHVLVAPEFESHPHFFYPTPYSQVIRTRDQQNILDIRDAKVDLAYLPFVRLRDAISPDLLQALDFNSLVNQLQRTFEEPTLLVNTIKRSLEINQNTIVLTPANFIFYYWMIERLLNGEPGIRVPPENYPNTEYRDHYLRLKDKLIGPMRDMDRTIEAIKMGMSKEFIAQRKTSNCIEHGLSLNPKKINII
ncbi:CRISPR-associated ring nuclease Csm6 [Thiomicrospira sp. R3]|uniref:CRISPR-associated ring nuclease Csm6 n=1 Tax=Thiomicrospira sp. R3 TaxID=3035472 RepID=UPI00259B2E19|nr:CRISPR-associated ring nuclease Csm6 [Thiomicrospira sp. R3]WFE69474.1 CRISPR-associated ring nuclease Csm6 [Thiomicrospira sp. R3]